MEGIYKDEKGGGGRLTPLESTRHEWVMGFWTSYGSPIWMAMI